MIDQASQLDLTRLLQRIQTEKLNAARWTTFNLILGGILVGAALLAWSKEPHLTIQRLPPPPPIPPTLLHPDVIDLFMANHQTIAAAAGLAFFALLTGLSMWVMIRGMDLLVALGKPAINAIKEVIIAW
jgi:hypothetical protein